MSAPKVSVIIPTYNRAAFLKEAIESVLDQTLEDFELIIVDDGSTDSTGIVAQSFHDSRTIYLYQKNQGVAKARNVGVASSKAPFIAFLDSDDTWLPKKLETQAAFLGEHSDISICQTEELWVRRGVRVNPCAKHKKASGWIFEKCLPLCIVSPSAVMMRRGAFDALGGFDETFPACEDYDLWLRAALAFEIHTLDEPLIVKRGGHADQLSRQWGLDRYRVRSLKKILINSKLPINLVPKVMDEIVKRCQILAKGAEKRENLEMSKKYKLEALRFTCSD